MNHKISALYDKNLMPKESNKVTESCNAGREGLMTFCSMQNQLALTLHSGVNLSEISYSTKIYPISLKKKKKKIMVWKQ